MVALTSARCMYTCIRCLSHNVVRAVGGIYINAQTVLMKCVVGDLHAMAQVSGFVVPLVLV